MALTATASQGFEFVGLTTGLEVFYLPGDPGVTFTRGDQVSMSNGVVILGVAKAAMIGHVAETTVCPAASVAAPRAEKFNPNVRASTDLCLVPVKLNVPGGVPIFEVTFANQFDDTLAAYTAATPSITLTTSPGANDDTNAAIIYVYEGPGRGEILIGDDYDHASKVLTTHRKANATLTTSSKVIVLEGEGGSVGGIGFMGRLNEADHNNLNVADGYNDGDWLIFMDWLNAPGLLHQLKLRVIRIAAAGIVMA